MIGLTLSVMKYSGRNPKLTWPWARPGSGSRLGRPRGVRSRRGLERAAAAKQHTAAQGGVGSAGLGTKNPLNHPAMSPAQACR